MRAAMLLSTLLAGTAWAGGVALPSELLVDGPMATRRSATAADLVLLYGGEQRGSLETCGCPHRPRGSYARVETVRATLAGAGEPVVLVNAGYAFDDPTGFDGAVRPDVAAGNGWVARGVLAGRWDAVNVGTFDAAALATLDPAVREGLPLVSANLPGPGVRPWVVVERSGVKVGITGVSGDVPTLGDRAAYPRRTDKAAVEVVAELAGQVDVVVLLAWRAPELAELIARKVDVDVIVDADTHREQLPAEPVGRALRVASHTQTMRLGELRMDLEAGAIVGGVDRQIDLDPTLGDDPGVLRLQEEARAALDRLQAGLYATP